MPLRHKSQNGDTYIYIYTLYIFKDILIYIKYTVKSKSKLKRNNLSNK